jgi:hypothetical protein
VEDEDGTENGGGGAGDGAEVRANFETGQETEKYNDRQSGD